MKILFFHRWVGVHKGGTETHVRELADRLQRLGHEVTILTREGQELSDFNSKVRIIRISKNRGESDHSYEDWRVYYHTLFFAIKSFFKLIFLLLKGELFDVISVHFFTEAIVAKTYTFFCRAPILFVLEGYTPLEAKAAKFADRKISISRFEAGMYRDKHSVDSVIIPVGVELSRFTVSGNEAVYLREKFAPSGQKIAITVCRLEPRKGIATLIKAVSASRKDLEGIRFLIIGDGISRKEIEQEIAGEGLNDRIFLCGKVSEKELPYYYACADFFILPTKQEWFGIVFIEAMASGLPVITTDVDACPEVVGDCGLYFKAEDYRALAGKIKELAENDSLRKDLSVRAIQRAANFDWGVIIKEYEKEYAAAAKYN